MKYALNNLFFIDMIILASNHDFKGKIIGLNANNYLTIIEVNNFS